MSDFVKSTWDSVAPSQGQKVLLGLIAAYWGLQKIKKDGVKGFVASIVNSTLSVVPGAQKVLEGELSKEVDKAVQDMFTETKESQTVPISRALAEKGISGSEIYRRLLALQTLDAHPDDGTLFAYIYSFGDEEEGRKDHAAIAKQWDTMSHMEIVKQASVLFMETNALNPAAFPSLRRMENEVVAISLNLFHAPEAGCGTMTSGGTESICMAIKTYRDYAKAKHGIATPNIVVPDTIHPAFDKAAHYFGVEIRHVASGADKRADVARMRAHIDSNTILLVGSAPQYPHGIIDPIVELGQVAEEFGLPLHVDACVGGFMNPFVEQLGYSIPQWDFRVSAVTSISADLHKYAYCPKGASVILYSADTLRKFQFFSYSGWPGGLFVSPSMLGSRGGASIAGAWASMQHLGTGGFLKHAKGIMDTVDWVCKEITDTPGLALVAQPSITIVAFASDDPSVNIYAVADRMEDEYKWNIERQQLPPCIHLSLMPVHSSIKKKFSSDLRAALQWVREHPDAASKGSAAMYGMVGNIPSGAIVDQFLKTFFQKVFSL